MPSQSKKRHISFLTGTRAELGLMLRTLAAIQAHPGLELSIVATGMHLDPRANPGGVKLTALTAAGLTPAAVIPWPPCVTPAATAEATACAAAHLTRTYSRLNPDLVLVVGDRVEAFAAATAAHISRIPVAHIHGGDKAEGQLDDSLRHAITKLSHLHLAATRDSAARIKKLGEHPRSIHLIGAPGVEAITKQAASKSDVFREFGDVVGAAIVLLHPTDPDPELEEKRAIALASQLQKSGLKKQILFLPNTDPGSEGIHAAWRKWSRLRGGADSLEVNVVNDLPRSLFLGLLRDCRLLAGNSSSGIIEAASFGCPVLNVGPRQSGRLHGPNVTHARHNNHCLSECLKAILARPRPKLAAGRSHNPYEQKNTARRIARILATSRLTHPAPPKLIAY